MMAGSRSETHLTGSVRASWYRTKTGKEASASTAEEEGNEHKKKKKGRTEPISVDSSQDQQDHERGMQNRKRANGRGDQGLDLSLLASK